MNQSLEAFCRGALSEPGWSNAHWFGFISACFLAYAFVGGICQKMSKENVDVAPYGLVWPFVLPWQIGSRLVDSITRARIPSARVVDRKDSK